jgi:hypothetical protein
LAPLPIAFQDGCIAVHDLAAAACASSAAVPLAAWRADSSSAGAPAAGRAPKPDPQPAEEEPGPITALAFHPRQRSVLFAAAGARLLCLELCGPSSAGGDASSSSSSTTTTTTTTTTSSSSSSSSSRSSGGGGGGGGNGPSLTLTACGPANPGGEEVNALAVHPGGGFLVAADDGGDITLFELRAGGSGASPGAKAAAAGGGSSPAPWRAVRAIKGAHPPIASCALFRRHRAWELLSGGMDARAARWDFSRGRPLGAWSMQRAAGPGGGGGPQVCNPPMVHGLAAPGGDGPAARRLAAAACGDGAVAVFSVEEAGGGGGSGGRKPPAGAGKKKPGSKQAQGQQLEEGVQQAAPAAYEGQDVSLVLGSEQGGHTRPVAAVAFLAAGGGARYLASGGEDRRLVVWDWQAALQGGDGGGEGSGGSGRGQDSGGSSQDSAAGGGEGRGGGAAPAPAPAMAGVPTPRPLGRAVGASAASRRGVAPPAPPLVLDTAPAPAVGAAPPRAAAWSHLHGRKVNALISVVAQRKAAAGASGPRAVEGQPLELLCVADTSKFITCYRVQTIAQT